MDKMEFDVFFDFAWPFVYNAAVWLDKVKEHYGEDLQLNWRNFSLQQSFFGNIHIKILILFMRSSKPAEAQGCP